MNDALKNALAEEMEVDPMELTSEKVLEDIEAWDSVLALTIMVILGDELGAPVTPGEMANLVTFGDIESLASSKIQN
jgi:acyl carrier protein|tara:strand:- start:136 stop:366 length:231 start_codon:yes stop_codon:yes gene_type:complete